MFTHTLFLLAGMFLSGGAENYVTPPMVEVYGESIVDREVVVPPVPELPAVVRVPEELPVPIPEFLVETPLPLPVEEEVPLLVPPPPSQPLPVNDRAVAPAVAETPVAVKTAPAPAATVPVPEPAAESQPERPWGLLAFTFFLLLLSLSANVFLAWQFWQQRKVLEEVVKRP